MSYYIQFLLSFLVKKMKKFLKYLSGLSFIFLAFPAGTSYKLEGFSFGGGGNQTNGTNYRIQGRIGEITNNMSSGFNYNLGAGLAFQRQSAVPPAPTWTNINGVYNKLHLVINNLGNPSDTKFAVAISKDSFATMQYVKNDFTVGGTLALTDYLTYSQWGDSTGVDVVGLESGTNYSVKVRAMQGAFTESAWGPVVSVGTSEPQLSFDIDVSPTDQKTAPPYLIDLGDLIVGNVVTSNSRVWVDFDTNAASGGSVFVYGQNGGLVSTTANASIGATTADLSIIGSGFGLQSVSVGQTSGGPLVASVGFSGSGSYVGKEDATVRNIFDSLGPISSGRGSFVVKAKSSNSTPAAGDYTEILTVIASGNY